MRILSLKIRNFRAIDHLAIDELKDFIVIAGPNGCGKSTVLDAIRLVKSVYVINEWNKWFSEFSINLERPSKFSTLFRNPKKPIEIDARFVLTERERKFLINKAENIALSLAISTERNVWIPINGDPPIIPPSLAPSRIKQVKNEAKKFANEILATLKKSAEFSAGVTMSSTPEINTIDSPIAHAAFSCFNPDALGEIEFHGSRRVYSREAVNNIRLNVGDRSEERRNRFLYDLENKYKNVKTQLGEEYIAWILKNRDPAEGPLQKSVKELFRTFFPGKEFLGVGSAEDNSMTFPVKLDTGEIHDIDELSSGEKEIVYGYLWLRTGTPRQSVILVDEPELHLNPALVQGLPSFYKFHLADALEAQVWIVTHSDAILRQAVRAPNMAVYHMSRPLGDGAQQARKIDSKDAIEAAVLDLIGDLAAYRPHAKIVLVEGHKETRFDVDVIRRLFPDFAERGNFIPVGNRRMTSGVRVRLLEILAESGLTSRAVSISDGDIRLGMAQTENAPTHFTWPVYEIENFLLSPTILRGATATLLGKDTFRSDKSVVDLLRKLAATIVKELALIEVQKGVNDEFFKAMKIGGSANDAVAELVRSADGSKKRVNAIDASTHRINKLFSKAEDRFSKVLKTDKFLSSFPGDRLMRAFAGHHSMTGDHFRNVCLDYAQRIGWRPKKMEKVLSAALK